MDNSTGKPVYAEVISKRRSALSDICEDLFESDSKIVWEVGCGHGHFLTAFAEAHRDQLCIGIDIVLDRIDRAERKRKRAQLANLRFLRADARDFLAALPAGMRFAAIYMLFPDPWPKRRHHKHRLLDPGFLDAVAQRAGQGARFYFRTDYKPYFAEAAATFASHPDWDTCPNVAWPFEIPTIFQQKAAHYQSLVSERNRH